MEEYKSVGIGDKCIRTINIDYYMAFFISYKYYSFLARIKYIVIGQEIYCFNMKIQ